MFAVNDEVVLFAGTRPCQHNTEHNPAHPCRGKVLKVGRKYYTIQSTGSPTRIQLNNAGIGKLYTVAEARKLHRLNFLNDSRPASVVDAIINKL